MYTVQIHIMKSQLWTSPLRKQIWEEEGLSLSLSTPRSYPPPRILVFFFFFLGVLQPD
jgi:hypothetical protein